MQEIVLPARYDLPVGSAPDIPSLGLSFSGAQPTTLFPTDVYTHEYDGFADFPQYPINVLSVLNAVLGIALQHSTYLGLSPEDIANAVLLQPALRVLVNLGYGNIEHGWSPGFADVPTGLGFLPDASVLQQVPQALADGVQKDITDFFARLADPANYVYTLPEWVEQLLREAAFVPGSETSFLSMVPTTWQDLFETFPPHTGIPALDMLSAVLLTLPQYNYEIFTSELAAGNLLDAIGIPIAADLGLLPLILLGAVF